MLDVGTNPVSRQKFHEESTDNFLLTLKWVILSWYKGVAHSNVCVVVCVEMPLAERRMAVSFSLCFPLTLSW